MRIPCASSALAVRVTHGYGFSSFAGIRCALLRWGRRPLRRLGDPLGGLWDPFIVPSARPSRLLHPGLRSLRRQLRTELAQPQPSRASVKPGPGQARPRPSPFYPALHCDSLIGVSRIGAQVRQVSRRHVLKTTVRWLRDYRVSPARFNAFCTRCAMRV